MATEFVSGNIFIRPMRFDKAGELHQGHTHNFDHTTIFFRGRFRVEAETPDGRLIVKEVEAPHHLLIKAEVKHKIVALTDHAEAWCVYSHRDPNPDGSADIVQHYTGWEDAYR